MNASRIIDIHTHTFPQEIARKTIQKLSSFSRSVPFTDGTEEGLRTAMAASGVDISVMLPVATSPSQVVHINTAAARQNAAWDEAGQDGRALQSPDNAPSGQGGGERISMQTGCAATAGSGSNPPRLFSLGCMHPDFPDWKRELRRIKELGLRGIKVHPPYQNADLDDVRYLRIFSLAAELDLLVVTHTGLDIGLPDAIRCTPAMARRVLREIGDFKLVLAHMGGWKNWEEVPEALADTGAFLDTSFSTGKIHPLPGTDWQEKDLEMLDTAHFMELYAAFGADRILFGTDSPWSRQDESLAFLRALPIGQAEKDKILGGNAAGLLGLAAF